MDFRIYRYHLTTLSNDNIVVNVDGKSEPFTSEQLKKDKNTWFVKALNNIDFYKNKKNILKIEFNDEDIFVIKLANQKQVTVVENFVEKKVPTQPFVYILINNDSSVQKIAISHNTDAFSSPNVVKNILLKELETELNNYGLAIEIEGMYEKEAVWKMLRAHKNEIKSLEITYVKPNLADISSALPADFKNLTENVNSQKSSLSFTAPSNGVLENINKDNPTIKGLIDYTSEGAGNVKIGIKGYRKKVSSKDTPVEIGIDEATFEGDPKEIKKIIKELL